MLGWGNIEYLLELHEKEMNKTGWISNFHKNEEIRNVEYAKVKGENVVISLPIDLLEAA
ncbi:hypothetical protein MOE21_11920 [Bacillus atrophaeus]|uniref:hypothetical protein n=1 Tax=Bacillus atrophaeus TaxID=1452 RepID=UPI00228274B9|nr:hypothetical protein [Bacillus atrophaeus]MCY8933331.1 hypothetical protein [Bacillus atrophaeus]